MIRLAELIKRFEPALLREHGDALLPSHRRALAAFKSCRNELSARMAVACGDCLDTQFIPHSCGHRSCPHCQAHESQQWIARQQAKQLPCDYFMITFTLPSQWRSLVWQQQKTLYELIIRCAWETISSFSENDKALQGATGAVTVLHTHNRRLDLHPHVHLVMPAGAINQKQKRWRSKKSKYLFSHKALAKVFRAKMLDGITQAGLRCPVGVTEKWIVDCKQVGSGAKAIVYLGRYLYRGVIAEKDILSCQDGRVRFRYRDSKTKKWETRTVSGVEFLRLLLQHILPKGFRRARNHGLLHPNSKRTIALLQLELKVVLQPFEQTARPAILCACCGGVKRIVRTRIGWRARQRMGEAMIRTPISVGEETCR
ncbi:MAG: IS91 family transposase [Telluria sp.]